MIRTLFKLVMLAIFLNLSACSIPRSDIPALKIYTIQPPEIPAATTQLPVHLVIRVNYTSPALDSNKIITMPEVNRYDHIANTSWPATLPFYMRDLLIRTFIDSHAFHSVGNAPVSGMPNYALDVQIYNFEARYSSNSDAPIAYIRLGASIARLDTNNPNVESNFDFSANQQVEENNMHAIIDAFESAFGRLALQLQTSITRLVSNEAQLHP